MRSMAKPREEDTDLEDIPDEFRIRRHVVIAAEAVPVLMRQLSDDTEPPAALVALMSDDD